MADYGGIAAVELISGTKRRKTAEPEDCINSVSRIGAPTIAMNSSFLDGQETLAGQGRINTLPVSFGLAGSSSGSFGTTAATGRSEWRNNNDAMGMGLANKAPTYLQANNYSAGMWPPAAGTTAPVSTPSPYPPQSYNFYNPERGRALMMSASGMSAAEYTAKPNILGSYLSHGNEQRLLTCNGSATSDSRLATSYGGPASTLVLPFYSSVGSANGFRAGCVAPSSNSILRCGSSSSSPSYHQIPLLPPGVNPGLVRAFGGNPSASPSFPIPLTSYASRLPCCPMDGVTMPPGCSTPCQNLGSGLSAVNNPFGIQSFGNSMASVASAGIAPSSLSSSTSSGLSTSIYVPSFGTETTPNLGALPLPLRHASLGSYHNPIHRTQPLQGTMFANSTNLHAGNITGMEGLGNVASGGGYGLGFGYGGYSAAITRERKAEAPSHMTGYYSSIITPPLTPYSLPGFPPGDANAIPGHGETSLHSSGRFTDSSTTQRPDSQSGCFLYPGESQQQQLGNPGVMSIHDRLPFTETRSSSSGLSSSTKFQDSADSAAAVPSTPAYRLHEVLKTGNDPYISIMQLPADLVESGGLPTPTCEDDDDEDVRMNQHYGHKTAALMSNMKTGMHPRISSNVVFPPGSIVVCGGAAEQVAATDDMVDASSVSEEEAAAAATELECGLADLTPDDVDDDGLDGNADLGGAVESDANNVQDCCHMDPVGGVAPLSGMLNSGLTAIGPTDVERHLAGNDDQACEGFDQVVSPVLSRQGFELMKSFATDALSTMGMSVNATSSVENPKSCPAAIIPICQSEMH